MGLLAADKSGTSDPFCKLHLPGQQKSFKSKRIMKTLNPVPRLGPPPPAPSSRLRHARLRRRLKGPLLEGLLTKRERVLLGCRKKVLAVCKTLASAAQPDLG